MTPHHLFPDVTWANIHAEIAREVSQRRETYPRLVAKGMRTQQECDRELMLMEAIGADSARFEAADGRPGPAAPATHTFTWRERCDAIRRELAWRARVYPDLARKGRPPSPAQAEIYNQRLACMLAIYEDGRDWKPSNGTALPLGRPGSGTEAHAEARVEWCTIGAHLAHRDGREDVVDGYLRMIALDDRSTADALRPSFAKQQEMAL